MFISILLQKKWSILLLVLSLCGILIIGCNNSNESGESKESAQTKTTEKKETETSDVDVSGAKDITEGKIYEAIADVADIDYIKTLEVEGEIGLYIQIKEDTPVTVK